MGYISKVEKLIYWVVVLRKLNTIYCKVQYNLK